MAPPKKKTSAKSAPSFSQNPYKEVDASSANLFRSLLPVPDNLAQMAAKVVYRDARMNNESLDDEQKLILWNTIQNAKKRTGLENSGTEYADYGNLGYGTPDKFNAWFNRGKIGGWDLVKNSLTNPGFKLASTIGRGRYWTDPQTGNVYYTDVYDWNPSEKNFIGANTYQTLRNAVRSGEDKNLNKEKNEPYRMNFMLNPAEIERIKKSRQPVQAPPQEMTEGFNLFKRDGGWVYPTNTAYPEYGRGGRLTKKGKKARKYGPRTYDYSTPAGMTSGPMMQRGNPNLMFADGGPIEPYNISDLEEFKKANKAYQDSLYVRSKYNQSFSPDLKTRPINWSSKKDRHAAEFFRDERTGFLPYLVEYDPNSSTDWSYWGHFKKPVRKPIYTPKPEYNITHNAEPIGPSNYEMPKLTETIMMPNGVRMPRAEFENRYGTNVTRREFEKKANGGKVTWQIID